MSRTVLIVDDSKLARMALAKLLAKLRPDWKRKEAANADEALAAVSHEVDVALLDFNMPGRDGLQVAAEFRRLYPEMPIAVVSANNQQEVVNRARAAGAAFLPKPLTEDVLKSFVDEAAAQLERRA